MNSRLFFVTVVLAILVASLPGAAPVSAAETRAVGNETFVAQPMPSNTGFKLQNASDITDLAVSADGTAIYVVDGQTLATAAAMTVYKSTDGGMTFSAVASPLGWAQTTTFRMIAVSSDSADSFIISDGTDVWVSTNGGSLWTLLPRPVVAGTTTITSVAVGPARSGTLLGKEYAVAVANVNNNSVTGGDVLVIGGAAANWMSAGVNQAAVAPAYNRPRDYMAVRFSPNFVGDRSVVALGATNAASGGPEIVVQVLNTAGITATTPGTMVVSTVLPALVPSTIDYAASPAGANIVKASIALPTDYDATTSSGRRSYVGFAAFSGAASPDNDVYRVDDTTATRLSAFSGAGIYSVAYGGTVDNGALFMGRESTVEVRYSTNPTSSNVTWTATKKIMPVAPFPAGLTAAETPRNTVVVASPKFATNNTVYAGTSGVESGFSISVNGGLTFNQTAMIDIGQVLNNTNVNQNLAFTSDGKTLFMSSRSTYLAGAVPANVRFLSLWKSAVPLDNSSWTRVFSIAAATAAGTTWVMLSKDYASTNCLFFFDKEPGGILNTIYRSTDSGDIFASRIGPSGALIGTQISQDANIIYVTDAGVNIYKSTTGGWTWESSVTPGIGNIQQLAVPMNDTLLVGGVGFVGYSTDQGRTFTRIAGFAAAHTYRISTDPAFSTNKTFYAAPTAGGGVYRYAIDSDAAFVDLGAPNAALATAAGFGVKSGVLYVPYNGRIDRTLYPLEPAGRQEWVTLDQPGGAPFAGGTSLSVTNPANTLYMKDSAVNVWAMYDYLAAAKPRIASPANNSIVPLDPVSGRADLITVFLEPLGTGTGLVAGWEFQIADRAAGWGAATLSPIIIATQPTMPTIQIGQTASVGPAPAGAAFGSQTGGWTYTMKANTSYMLRVRAALQVSGENAQSQWSDPINLSVAALMPVVTTANATAVTGTSATLNGSLNDTGAWPAALVSFEWGLTNLYGNITPPVSMNATGAFSFNLTGLSPNTTYHFRARALGVERFSSVPTYGADRVFTTSAALPTVVTGAATNRTANSALLNGFLNDRGSAETVGVSFEWGRTLAYDNATATVPASSVGPFSVLVSGLSPGTTYHFRAKAVGDGTGYGADQTFITPLSASPLSVARHLPDLVSRGQTFQVNVNFWAPPDNFTSLALTDFAPAGWTVAANRLASLPSPDADNSAGNRVEYLWYSGSHAGGTSFGVSYNVTVPATATPGRYSFLAGFLEYNNGTGAGPFIAEVGGDYQVEVATIEGMTYGASGVVLAGVTVTMDSAVAVVGDGTGVYRIGATATGSHSLVASKTGFRSQTQALNVAAPGTTYVLDFKGDTGLVPNAPDLSYVLACVNKWKVPPDGLGLSLSKVLSVVNAWKFPI